MIETNNAKHTGILIPRYEYAEVNHLVLKLKNGYNIGINLEKIKSIKKTPEELDPTKSVIHNNLTEDRKSTRLNPRRIRSYQVRYS